MRTATFNSSTCKFTVPARITAVFMVETMQYLPFDVPAVTAWGIIALICAVSVALWIARRRFMTA